VSIKKEEKLNKLLQDIPKESVILSSWLISKGYSHSLQHRYLKSNWLEPIGSGAFKRKNDEVSVFGALYALQHQNRKDIHLGGISALSLLGYAHYIEMGTTSHSFFAQAGCKLPKWFKNNVEWKHHQLFCSSFLPPQLGIMDYDLGNLKIKISTQVRAMMECLEIAPKNFDLAEAYLIMEGLTSLQPSEVQKLLEACTSIKVKRLFLYFSEVSNHTWFKYLDIDKLNLGSGKRSIVKDGIYNARYRITVPQKIN
jgi:hypothetical protein